MEKSQIKAILREAFVPHVEEASQSAPNKAAHGKSFETDYAEITRKLDGTMLKASQVMAAAKLGNPNDATDRSLFSKKVRRETNDEGGKYQFNDKELAAIINVLNNPAAFLNVKQQKKK